ncbi:hypothetical protein [Rhizobium sp.]|uniref:hypothetical protein n=1 Tax=Rhizobium sp. TaxID=391 RepID=UPI0028969C9D
MQEEEASRQAIVEYKPRGDCETKMRLTYLAAYLIATRGRLTPEEMRSIADARHDRPQESNS